MAASFWYMVPMFGSLGGFALIIAYCCYIKMRAKRTVQRRRRARNARVANALAAHMYSRSRGRSVEPGSTVNEFDDSYPETVSSGYLEYGPPPSYDFVISGNDNEGFNAGTEEGGLSAQNYLRNIYTPPPYETACKPEELPPPYPGNNARTG